MVVTLFLDTQNNTVRSESISMENTCLPSGCPVVACTPRFLHLRDHDAYLNTPMCVYFERKGAESKYVTTSHLTALLCLWYGEIEYSQLGFHPHEIGSHSLRSGGAMTLHQAYQSDSTIKIIDRWRSNAFLIYLQGQVATFTKGVSVAMRQVMWFTSTSWGEKGTDRISLLGIEASGEVVHTHSLLCVSAGDYAKPDLWGC